MQQLPSVGWTRMVGLRDPMGGWGLTRPSDYIVPPPPAPPALPAPAAPAAPLPAVGVTLEDIETMCRDAGLSEKVAFGIRAHSIARGLMAPESSEDEQVRRYAVYAILLRQMSDACNGFSRAVGAVGASGDAGKSAFDASVAKINSCYAEGHRRPPNPLPDIAAYSGDTRIPGDPTPSSAAYSPRVALVVRMFAYCLDEAIQLGNRGSVAAWLGNRGVYQTCLSDTHRYFAAILR